MASAGIILIFFYVCAGIAVLLFFGSLIVLFGLAIPSGKKAKKAAAEQAAPTPVILPPAATPPAKTKELTDKTAPLPRLDHIKRFVIIKKEIYTDIQESIDDI